MSEKIYFPSRGVNLEWVGNLELLEVNDPPGALPGATVQRVWSPDDRLVIRDAKDSDLVCFYESIAAVRHKKSLAIFVVFRETIDALMSQQKDPKLYPKWLMDHPAKRAERRFFISRAYANPKQLAIRHGRDEMWFEEWLAPVADKDILESLIYYLTQHGIGNAEMFVRS